MNIMFNYETLADPLLQDLRKSIPEFSGIKAGDKVIDVCCGTVSPVFEYGRYVIIATGVDSSQNMLKMATRDNDTYSVAYFLPSMAVISLNTYR